MSITEQEYTDLFQTEAGKKAIVRNLKGLVKTKGWTILMMYFKALVERQEGILHDINSPVGEEELQKIRIKLYYIKELMDTPEILARGILESKGEDIPDDVYE